MLAVFVLPLFYVDLKKRVYNKNWEQFILPQCKTLYGPKMGFIFLMQNIITFFSFQCWGKCFGRILLIILNINNCKII